MLRDILDRRPADPRGGVVPAKRATGAMLARVQPIARIGGEVDAADERLSAVDNHELFMVAVHGPLAGIESYVNLGLAPKFLGHRAHLAAIGLERGHRSTGPSKQSDRRPLGHGAQQLRQGLRAVRAQPEIGREIPAREPDRRTSALDRRGYLRQCVYTIDEYLQAVAGSNRRTARGPPPRGRIEDRLKPEPSQTSPVMRDHEPLDGAARRRVQPLHQARHTRSWPRKRTD